MGTFSTSEARFAFSDVINRAAYGKERVVLTRRGKQIVAVIPVEDLKLIEEIEDRLDVAAAKRAWAAQGKESPAPWAEVKKRLALGQKPRRATKRK